ncbi:MAG: TlpA family protein disulfide reductase, partial [Acidimicrobiia bacterium]|nr:TlpA family protein disulfide reductase [Acidimicrobiia bacterium]
MWQALHAELEPVGLTVVTVALDVEPAKAHRWIDAAQPTHPSLVDRAHVTDELFGFVNVPMAVWIDEEGTIVRPAEHAALEPRTVREVPPGTPERLAAMLEQVNAIADIGDAYRAAVVDWARHGADSRYALTAEEVVARSRPRPPEHARAAACFELGEHLRRAVGEAAAVP